MAKVIITKSLEEQINKKFKGESVEILGLMHSLKENPTKGKPLGQIGGILIKELRYKSFRFYFIVEGFKIKILDVKELDDLFIKFIRMSDKKDQQKTIEEIKGILKKLGREGF